MKQMKLEDSLVLLLLSVLQAQFRVERCDATHSAGGCFWGISDIPLHQMPPSIIIFGVIYARDSAENGGGGGEAAGGPARDPSFEMDRGVYQ